jgi:putative serine protease PepD
LRAGCEGVLKRRVIPTPTIRLRATARVLVLVACAAAALGACGKSGDGNTVTATAASAQTTEADASAAPAPSSTTAAPAGATSPALSLQQQFERVVRLVSPSVVQIESGGGLGSGVVYDGKGDIVTNAHVVGNSRSFKVTLGAGETHAASLVGSFPAGDLAVVKLSGATPRAATFADSSKVRVGEFALAIGNPLGLRSSVTDGIVSSLGRTVSEGQGATITSAIQTSAPINPGNSGGALVDLEGRVIGIPTLAALDPELGGAQAPGIGFAIPSSTVRNIASQLIASGRVQRSGRAFLGIGVATVTAGGVLVASVEKGGPADKAGIRPGDVIVSVDGRPTPSTDELTTVLAGLKPGQKVPVTLVRNGQRMTVTVTLGELPAG